MTNVEAIEILKDYRESQTCFNEIIGESVDEFCDALGLAISALEKQVGKKPKRIDKNDIFDGNWIKVCPTCGKTLMERITTEEISYPRHYNMTSHCWCGQRIDWSDEE